MFHKDSYRDANGVVRPDLREEAMRDFDALPVESGYVWRSIGPAEGWTIAGSTLPRRAGLVSDIAFDSTRQDLLIATRAGGLWRSRDAGVSWRSLCDGLPSLQTASLSRFDPAPGSEPILMCGTGELDNERLRFTGLVGLFRSVDGGKTWCAADAGAGATLFRSHDVNEVMAVDANRILVATRVGLFFSADGARNFGNNAPHHDNGRPHLRGNVTAMAIEGNEVAAVVAGDLMAVPEPMPPELDWQLHDPHAEFGLWLATLSATSLGSFGAAPAHRTLGLVSDPDVGNTLLSRKGRFFVMSVAKLGLPRDTFVDIDAHRREHHSIQITQAAPTNAGQWRTLDSTPLNIGQAYYSHYVHFEPLGAAPAVPPALWFGTVGLFRGQVERRSSGAWQWRSGSPRSVTGGRIVHADQHVIQSLATGASTRTTYVGNDGGLYRTQDEGTSWTALNQHGTALFWSIALARKDATTLRIVAGLQDNGSIVGEGPDNPSSPSDWHYTDLDTSGDGGALALIGSAADHAQSDNPGEVLVTANGSLIHATGAAALTTWTLGAEEVLIDPDRLALPPDDQGPIRFPFSECLVVARGEHGVWNRFHYSFAAARNGPSRLWRRDGAHPFVRNNFAFPAMITALAAAPEDAASENASPPGAWENLWIGLANGEVFFSSDGGINLSRVPVPVPVSGKSPVMAIAVDPTDSRRVAFAFGGYAERARNEKSGKVVLTTDRGVHDFQDISGERGPNGFVPDVVVLGIAFTRTTPSALIISTDMGALVTYGPNLGERWSRLGVGLPKLACVGVSVLNGFPGTPVPPLTDGLPLAAVGTFGRGAYLLVRPTAPEPVIEFEGGFGAALVGSTLRHKFTIHNPGASELVATIADAAPVFTFEGLASTNLHVPARGKLDWTVLCQPTSAGVQTANLVLTVGASSTNIPVSCEAVADGPPRLAIWPKTVRFGRIPEGQVVEEAIHIVNRGHSNLHIIGAAPNGTPSASFTLASPPAMLTPGQETTIALRFTASTRGTTHNASFRFDCDDPIDAPEHLQIDASAEVIDPTPSQGIPGWVWWVVAGAAVTGAVVGGVVVYEATKSDS